MLSLGWTILASKDARRLASAWAATFDFLDPVEMAVERYRAIPGSALWIVPHGGHGPVFLDAKPQFVQTALAFFRG
jgi:pimeloyl-ACP methyl ester carboxylesterase